jgi:hypothetical protein
MAQVIFTGTIPPDGFVSVSIINDGAPLAAGAEYTVSDEQAEALISRGNWQAATPPAETPAKRRRTEGPTKPAQDSAPDQEGA